MESDPDFLSYFCLAIVHYFVINHIIKPKVCMGLIVAINSFCIMQFLKIHSDNKGIFLVGIFCLFWGMAIFFTKLSKHLCKLIQSQIDNGRISDKTSQRKTIQINKTIANGCKYCNYDKLKSIIVIYVLWGAALFGILYIY